MPRLAVTGRQGGRGLLLDSADGFRHFGELAAECPLGGVAVAVLGEERLLDELGLGLLPAQPRDASQFILTKRI